MLSFYWLKEKYLGWGTDFHSGKLIISLRSSANHSFWPLSDCQCKTPLFLAVKLSFRVVLVK